MKYRGTLLVVKDCKKALKFYQEMFGFELLQDNDGNMELSNNLYLQELKYWEKFTKNILYNARADLSDSKAMRVLNWLNFKAQKY